MDLDFYIPLDCIDQGGNNGSIAWDPGTTSSLDDG